MNAEIISYRCTRAEYEALLLLLRLDPPPGMYPMEMDEGTFNAACDTLKDAEILADSSDCVVVDRLFAFLMREAAGADSALVFRGEEKHMILHSCEHCAMLTEVTHGNCAITPFPKLGMARVQLEHLLKHMTYPLVAEVLKNRDVLQSTACDTLETGLDAFDGLYDHFFSEARFGKELS